MKRSGLIGYKVVSDVLSRLCSLAVVVLAARHLVPGDFGLFSLAWALGWIVSVAADWGLQLILTREVSRRPAKARSLFYTLLRVKSFLLAVVLLSVAGLVYLSGWPSDPWPFVLVVVSQILGSLIEFYNYLYRGLSRADLESSLNLAHRLTALMASIVALRVWGSFLGLAVALALSAGLTAAASARLADRKWLQRPGLESDSRSAADQSALIPWRRLTREAFPVGLGIVLSALYFRLDLFFIEWWRGSEAVGLYSAAFRIIDALRLFPAAVVAVIFPELCRTSEWKTLLAWSGGVFGLGLLGFSFLAGTAAFWIRLLFGPEYVAASPTFQILLLSLPLLFVNLILTHQLIGWNLQRLYTWLCVAGLGSSLLFNAILVPALGIRGAALACLLREGVLTGGAVFALTRSFSRAVTGEVMSGPETTRR